MEYLKVSSAFFCFLINGLVQVFSFRRFPKLGLLKSIYAGFSCGLFVFSCAGFIVFFKWPLTLSDYMGFLVSGLVTYACLSYCYFHFLNLGETARRIRILRELYDSKDGLTYEDLLKRYNAETILDVRLKRLEQSGQIEYKEGRYRIARPMVLFFARMILAMKKLLYGKKSDQFV